jgi:uncharacterized membrane protein (UPF0127 family)
MWAKPSKLAACFLLAGAAACARSAGPAIPTAPPGGALMAFGKHVIAVEVAADAAEWQRGLMGRKHMAENSGMLFVFPSPQRLGFWMKDTLIPLQIAFLQRTTGQSYRVAKLFEMTPCHADPCHIYDPATSYDVALEANAGWFSTNHIHVGSVGKLGSAPSGK